MNLQHFAESHGECYISSNHIRLGQGCYGHVVPAVMPDKVVKTFAYNSGWTVWAAYCMFMHKVKRGRSFMPRVDLLVVDESWNRAYALVERLQEWEAPGGQRCRIQQAKRAAFGSIETFNGTGHFSDPDLSVLDEIDRDWYIAAFEEVKNAVAMSGGSDYYYDLHEYNLLQRRTRKGVQIVVNDPLEYTATHSERHTGHINMARMAQALMPERVQIINKSA